MTTKDSTAPANGTGGQGGYERPTRFGILLVPGYSMMTLAAMIDPLRQANEQTGRKLYEWSLFSIDGEPVTCSSDIALDVDFDLNAEVYPDVVMVCAGYHPQRNVNKSILAWLRVRARRGAVIGGTSTGSLIVAAAGLLDGYRATIHWENQAGFVELFPNVIWTGNILEIDRNRYTCSGGDATLDLMLNIISRDHGSYLAMIVSSEFQHGRIRTSSDNQSVANRRLLKLKSARVSAAIDVMERHLEEPLTLEEVSEQAQVSRRQLERLFRHHLGCSPGKYYLDLRLDFARSLLLQTEKPVTDIAFASGFVTLSHFSKSFRQRFGISPRQERLGAC